MLPLGVLQAGRRNQEASETLFGDTDRSEFFTMRGYVDGLEFGVMESAVPYYLKDR